MISRRQATCKANLENQGNGCQLNENMDSDTCDEPRARHKRHRSCPRQNPLDPRWPTPPRQQQLRHRKPAGD